MLRWSKHTWSFKTFQGFLIVPLVHILQHGDCGYRTKFKSSLVRGTGILQCCWTELLTRPWEMLMSRILNITLRSDLDDTASVEHECHYQKLWSMLFFFFLCLLLMKFKGLIVKFMKSLPVMRGLWIPSKWYILFSEQATSSLLGVGGCVKNWRIFLLVACILVDDALKI